MSFSTRCVGGDEQLLLEALRRHIVVPRRPPSPRAPPTNPPKGAPHEQGVRGVPLREADLARDQRRRRAGQGLHRPVRRRRAARAAPAARRRPRLPGGHRPRRRQDDPRQDARAADRRLRLHRPRHGLPRHDQQRLRALHAPRARHHQVARLPRLQEDHPAQRPRLEHAEPRPRRPPHQPGDRRRVRPGRVVEPADGGQGRSCRAGGRASSPAAAPTPASWRRRCTSTSTATTSARTRSRAATISFNEENSPFNWVDCSRPGRRRSLVDSSYSDTGVLGEAELATAEKGKRAYEEAVKQLVASSTGSRTGRRRRPRDRHRKPPTMPIPWGQILVPSA